LIIFCNKLGHSVRNSNVHPVDEKATKVAIAYATQLLQDFTKTKNLNLLQSAGNVLHGLIDSLQRPPGARARSNSIQ
jgi:hypothetical protein